MDKEAYLLDSQPSFTSCDKKEVICRSHEVVVDHIELLIVDWHQSSVLRMPPLIFTSLINARYCMITVRITGIFGEGKLELIYLLAKINWQDRPMVEYRFKY